MPLVFAEGLEEELGLGFVGLGDADGLAVPVALGDVLGDALGLGEGSGVVDVMRKGRVV